MIGTSWRAVEGKREIVSLQTYSDGIARYGVSTEGNRTWDLFNLEEMAGQIEFEQEQYRQYLVRLAQAEEAILREKEAKAKADDTDGFADRFPLMQRGKLLATLQKTVRNAGRVISRRDLVREKVAAGWRVEIFAGVRMLKDAEGWYLSDREITKTGLNYAEWLIGKGR